MAVSDAEILAMQRRLAMEGLWVEPASAAGFAGLVADEAAIPTPELAEQGYQSIHRTATHAVGEAE
jgi:hypothetical protein